MTTISAITTRWTSGDQRRAGGIADQGIGGAQIEEDGEQHPDEQDELRAEHAFLVRVQEEHQEGDKRRGKHAQGG